MSSHTSAKSLTPGSSARQATCNLAQKLSNYKIKEDLEEDDNDEELKQQLAKANSNIKQIYGIFNESA
ncbi:hypothetical protein CKAH01_14714 [Colletotrichum kahawae]|uniref:Uncharacterized protein n=1 Tax=Colletotrichum kahawae TaxID=34407 RepID=A0AAD9YJC0_COLKA|nr:hypothetical protein CKAH01_14714 [Colletotrichum kahawae]